jgi:hypothetical protein
MRLDFALMLLAVVGSAAGAQFDPRTVPQGAFDQGLAPWSVDYGTPTWDGSTGHQGPGCLKIVNSGTVVSPLLPIGEEFLQLTAWMKTENIVRGVEPWHQATIQVIYFDKDQKNLGHFDPLQAIGTTDWQKAEALLHWDKKAGVAFFQVALMNWNCTGTSWFDDVTLSVAPVPESYRLVPPLEQVENSPPRLWPMPKLGQPVSSLHTDLLRWEGPGVRVSRMDGKGIGVRGLQMSAGGKPVLEAPVWRSQIARGYMTRLATPEAAVNPPRAGTVEAYLEWFRGSPICSLYPRLWLANGSSATSLRAEVRLTTAGAELWGFDGNKLVRCAAGQLTLDQRTTKPFVILRQPGDNGGLIIYHPIPAELRRWYIEDYVVEAEPRVRVRLQGDTLSYRSDECAPGSEGTIHSLDFYSFFLPYQGKLAEAMMEFAVCDRDLISDTAPVEGEAPRGMWQPFMDYSNGQRLLKMARYFPREFSSHMDSSGWDYGHAGGHGWGCTTLTMKAIRVDPLSKTALDRDHALRMLTFFVEYAGPQGAPWDCYTWRGAAAEMGDPALLYKVVFCQYWEWRLGEFRSLLRNSTLLTASEKARLYRDLQRAKYVFDPRSPGSWTVIFPDGSYWFDYFDQPPTPRRKNLFIINTQTTSLGNVGEFALMAREMGQPRDEAWWTEVFRKGVDGTLWAMAQDFMWTPWDKNEVVYGGKSGGPQGYARYMVSAWLPQVLHLDVELGLEHRLDELLALQRRMMQARYVQADPETVRYGQEALDWVAGKRRGK